MKIYLKNYLDVIIHSRQTVKGTRVLSIRFLRHLHHGAKPYPRQSLYDGKVHPKTWLRPYPKLKMTGINGRSVNLPKEFSELQKYRKLMV